ncbi:MAG TPA: hypothetical protein V6D19_05525 [Stenomitos sp.]
MAQIFDKDGFLNFDDGELASKEQYRLADRSVGSIFESLNPGEEIELVEGNFVLDEDLDILLNQTGCQMLKD